MVSFQYDAENQLVRIDFQDGGYAAYRYDALGKRIEKDVNGAITKYIYDGEDILFEYDGTNTLVARYTQGSGIDQPISMDRGGQSYFYHADRLGSIRLLTDISGNIVQTYQYDSFGNIVDISGSLVNPYTFTGREYDSESGLYYYRARYYDPGNGRFISEDPIGYMGSDVNFYVYVGNNPTNLTDPFGLFGFPMPYGYGDCFNQCVRDYWLLELLTGLYGVGSAPILSKPAALGSGRWTSPISRLGQYIPIPSLRPALGSLNLLRIVSRASPYVFPAMLALDAILIADCIYDCENCK